MINLLPPEIKQDIRYGRLNTVLIRYSLLALVVAVGLLGIVGVGVLAASSDQNAIEESITEREATVAELEVINKQARDLSGKISTISQLLSDELKFSELLREVGSVLPPGVILTGLQLSDDRDAALTLSANVDTQTKAAVLRENLAESVLFSDAEIQVIAAIGSSDVSGGGESPYRFTTSITVFFADAETQAPSTTTEPESNTNNGAGAP